MGWMAPCGIDVPNWCFKNHQEWTIHEPLRRMGFSEATPIAIINLKHVLIRVPPPLRRMEFSEATPARASSGRICVGPTVLCSFGSIVAVLAFLTP